MSKTFKNTEIKKPVYMYKRIDDSVTYLPQQIFLDQNNKPRTVHEWADYRRYTKKRYPWLAYDDNFDRYIQKKWVKSGMNHEKGYAVLDTYNDWSQAGRKDFMHKKFKRERKEKINANKELAIQRRVQLAEWRKSGSKCSKPPYKNKPF